MDRKQGGEQTRREFLAVAGGTALAGSQLTLATRHKRRKPKPRNPLHQIEHIVVIMQENCSFDHYFGTLRGVRGFSDPHAMKLADGSSVFNQPCTVSPTGRLLPWHLSIADSDPCVTTADNGWAPTHSQLDGGKMDGFANVRGVDPMRYYTRADVPWHMALADAFTVCDGYFASVLGPTNPNRLYSMSGTINAAGGKGGPVTDNSQTPPYTWTTYPERLQAHRVSWRVYQQSDNFDDNALAWFRQYQQAQPGSPLYENGMRRRPSTAFADDIAAGKLPQVLWVISPAFESEHPGYAPGPGADFLAGCLYPLWSHPKVWAKTVVFVTYDEPGGYFDHVGPPLPPAGTPDEFVQGEPAGLGFRVPTIVCSPWSRGGYVCSDVFDHTSTLRFIERRFGVRETNIGAWRRKTCGDLTATLDLRHADHGIPALPQTKPLSSASQTACKTHPPGAPTFVLQKMPAQEPGTRPRRR